MSEIIWQSDNVPTEWEDEDDVILDDIPEYDEEVITAEDVAFDLAHCRKDLAGHQEKLAELQKALAEEEIWQAIQERERFIAALKKEASELEASLREATVLESKATKYAVKKFEWGEVKYYEGKDVVEIVDQPAALQWAVVNAPKHVTLAPTFNDAIAGLDLPFAKKSRTDDEYKLSIKKDLSGILPKDSESE